MDSSTANKIRGFVYNGGTVVMTSYSALVDETGQVFASTHPGRLSDVFGIRVGSYEETEALTKYPGNRIKAKKLAIVIKENRLKQNRHGLMSLNQKALKFWQYYQPR